MPRDRFALLVDSSCASSCAQDGVVWFALCVRCVWCCVCFACVVCGLWFVCFVCALCALCVRGCVGVSIRTGSERWLPHLPTPFFDIHQVVTVEAGKLAAIAAAAAEAEANARCATCGRNAEEAEQHAREEVGTDHRVCVSFGRLVRVERRTSRPSERAAESDVRCASNCHFCVG